MGILESKLDIIQPEIFSKEKSVQAWFTTKNKSLFSGNDNIQGLNLGLNTAESESTVERNRTVLMEDLDIDPHWVAYGEQVHSDRIQVVTQGGIYSGTDGFVTSVPRLALTIQVADCAAVLLADAKNRVIAAVHAGWRGAVSDIVPKAVKYMVAQRAEEKQIKAFISPCISLQHFEVGTEVAGQFPDRFVDYTSYDKPHVDLKGFIKYQLMVKGVLPEHIQVHEGCTVRDDNRYYSYRREGDKSGRMMGIIQLLKRDES
jgi:YfiH family protein